MSALRQNIIVVDDDAGMNLALRRLLNAAGFHAISFSSAEALLESKAVTQAACLILDVHLPGLSGFELQRRLRQDGPTRPVIFITAYEDPASKAEAQGAGAVAYLTKPFSGRLLLAAITEALAAV
jgi:FixJ family two-component response regulator